ncbi:hypothetical protein FB451DRAFT_1497840 [Mycena latifolia]|nr:hypothetical protein FB451DRAFT_1497840 [Mycena latifolia]
MSEVIFTAVGVGGKCASPAGSSGAAYVISDSASMGEGGGEEEHGAGATSGENGALSVGESSAARHVLGLLLIEGEAKRGMRREEGAIHVVVTTTGRWWGPACAGVVALQQQGVHEERGGTSTKDLRVPRDWTSTSSQRSGYDSLTGAYSGPQLQANR